MIRYIKFSILSVLILMAGCTKDFEELERPKTISDKIEPNALFTRSLVTGSGLSVGIWQWMHQISGSVYAQHFTNIQIGANFTSDNYEPRSWDLPWSWYFSASNFAPMMYNHHVINLSRELNYPIMESVARIWNVFLIQQVTDMYGDMPVSEAFVLTRPAFDAQKDIYLHMLSELKSSVDTIIKYENRIDAKRFGAADVIYNGNTELWKRFANTMMLRLALRASNTAEFDASVRPYLNGLDVNMTMNNNNHTARIIPDDGGPTFHVKNPLVFVRTWNEVRLSKTMVDMLKNFNDPRLQIYGSPNAQGEYQGLPNGLPHSYISENLDSDLRPNYNNIGTFFTRPDTPHYILTHAEASFMKAEAAQRGFIAGSAAEYYNQGITASFNQFGITDAVIINEYLDGPAKFDPAKALEQIWTQRWLALYPNGHEAWSLVRRTGVPQMMQPVYTFPGNEEMPRRKQFPTQEIQMNSANYQAAVTRMGGDSQYTRVWWDGGN
jgi:hypothetical protein